MSNYALIQHFAELNWVQSGCQRVISGSRSQTHLRESPHFCLFITTRGALFRIQLISQIPNKDAKIHQNQLRKKLQTHLRGSVGWHPDQQELSPGFLLLVFGAKYVTCTYILLVVKIIYTALHTPQVVMNYTTNDSDSLPFSFRRMLR